MPRPTLRLTAAALMVAGLSLVAAPLAAAAHTGNLYTWAYSEDSNFYGITDISTSDAAMTQLQPAPVDKYVSGADICNEVAWALVDGNQEGEIPGVMTWNHDTGVLGARQEMTANIADFPGSTDVDLLEASAADSLSDCSTIAYVRYRVTSGENTADPLYVSYVDVTTGLTTPITELPEVGEEQEFIDWNGIATNPVTGVTYLFAEFEDASNFVVLNVAAGTLSGLQAMDGVSATFGSEHFPSAADFQPDGKLWLMAYIDQLDAYRLLSFAPGSDLATASPTVVGDPNEGTNPVFYRGDAVLTYDPEALAATGAGVPLGLLVPGGALFLAGLALIAVRRARAAE